MINNYRGVEDIVLFNEIIQKLRTFFLGRGFTEVHTQDRLSILAACEDPFTLATFDYAGEKWPLPQTGQMWLEYELLSQPELPGVFCVSTSYRAEPNPIPGRHKIIFPLFEFEVKGTIDDLRKLEADVLEHLGFGAADSFPHKTYDELAEKYGTADLSHHEEKKMEQDFGPVMFLEKFPLSTSPFWNMKKIGEYANKIDVIVGGAETFGSAERSVNKTEMWNQFHSISDGKYAGKLHELFGKDRVEKELQEFLTFDFFPRYGGAVGITRMMDAYKRHNQTA